jgi:putative glycosyltransferase (TIGR04372 family)
VIVLAHIRWASAFERAFVDSRKFSMSGIVSQSIIRICRAADFLRSQAAKTVARPSRLFTIPFGHAKFRGKLWLRDLLASVLLCFPRLVPLAMCGLSARRLSSREGKEFCVKIGYELFQDDWPEESWQCLDRSIRAGDPSTDDYLLGSMCLYHGLGRFRDAMSLFAQSNELGQAEAEQLGCGKTPFRVLDEVWARHIGHTATVDYVLKLGILEGRAPEDTIWYVPRGKKIANRFLLQQVAAHLRFVDDPADLPFSASAVPFVHFDYLGPRLSNGTTAYFWEAASSTFKRWEQDGRAPLFSLPDDIKDRGWEALHKAGVPWDAWFVALHVREGTYDGRHAGMHGVHNAVLATYFPAIAEITRRGGWVIRMGDPSMTRLSPLPNVIDYCHSDLRADWMDIFIASQCRFMLGSGSGPVFIPPIYGVPSVITNWWPPAHRPLHTSDIFVPKLARRLRQGRYLTLTESLQEPFSYCHSHRYLAERGVYVEDNDPELIRAAVVEMLDRLDGTLRSSSEMSDLRARADRIYQVHDGYGSSPMAADFILRHGDLII